MSDVARQAVIAEHLKTLKLPAFTRDYAARARQARDGGWDYEDYLRELLEAEVISRRERCAARRLKAAQFPDHKTLEQIDWQALKGISKPKLAELASCDYLDRAEDVVFAGPIGTGKTHLAIALGHRGHPASLPGAVSPRRRSRARARRGPRRARAGAACSAGSGGSIC